MKQLTGIAFPVGIAWLVATAIHNFPDGRIDFNANPSLIRPKMPNWRFFGPNPGTKDSHLLYRDLAPEVLGSSWQEATTAIPRRWSHIFWNPGSRGPKALFDCTQNLLATISAASGDFELICESTAFRMLSTYTQKFLHHQPGTRGTQFMLIQSQHSEDGGQLVEPIFVSPEILVTNAGS